MGARRRGGKRGGGSRTSGNQWQDTDMQNAALEAYYKAQNILPEDELVQHFEAFRKPLPTTFRITGTRANAIMMRDYMQRTFIPYLTGKTFEDKPLEPPQPIAWYPDNLAYQLDIPKQAIRKNADFQAFQKFLVMESDSGNLVRQEVVSMIPPLLMNIKPDSTCLDMCAAPGSKTSQMVEYLHDGHHQPTGFVLANDTDFKRAHMLVHQVKRLNSPNFIVTNHDATFISNFYSDSSKTVHKFDRILADVPCSGDGTLRKNMDVWKNWSVTSGLSLHPTQVNCLRRGLQMLAIGGRLVYSTCSLNPIEDEAVLHAVLSQVGDAAHLVDVSEQLPSLKRYPGLHTWQATDTHGKPINSMEDVTNNKHKIPTTIFPPSKEEAERLHLERALRVYPHLGNTGGFFVAVIDKVKDIPGNFDSVRHRDGKRKVSDQDSSVVKKAKVETEEAPEVTEAVQSGKQEDSVALSATTNEAVPDESNEVSKLASNDTSNKPRFIKSLNDEYFKFLAPDHPDVQDVAKFYGLNENFRLDCFLSRNISGEPVRSLYYTSSLVKDLLIHNEGRIKFVHAGVKVFVRQNIDNLVDTTSESVGMCKWRVAQDGIDLVKDVVSQQNTISCTFDELTIFMQHEFPRAALFPHGPGTVVDQLNKKKYGCYLLRCDLTQDSNSRIPEVIVVPIWKSKVTIQMMIARKDKVAIYMRVTGKELPAAIKVDRDTVKQSDADTEAMESTAAADNEAEDQAEAIDTTISDAAATEEEGSAARVL